MSTRMFCSALVSLTLSAALSVTLSAGARQTAGSRGAPAPLPDNPQSLAHVEAARKLAGSDSWLQAPFNFYCVAGNARANNGNAPVREPAKLFDNLYAVGSTEATVYAITTSDGILLIDSDSAARVETSVVEGLKTLGLDPANVKYVLLGHGHADHFGGSAHLQQRYGAKVATTAADWDLIHPPNQPVNPDRPKRDVVVSEGQPLTLGDVTVTLVAIPGHTAGSLGFIFPVKEGGQTRTVGLFGGTILMMDRITTAGLTQYVASIAHYLDVARNMRVDVAVQNHPIFDQSPERFAALKARAAGDRHPFLVTTDKYVTFWNVISACIQAEIARRPPSP